VTLETRIVPELLAGVRVFIDNKLLDQSAIGRLERLRTKLQSAPLV
jgi:F0F1-type ATP synthase delta subunit